MHLSHLSVSLSSSFIMIIDFSSQILLIGASGSGKTTLVQNLAQATRSTIVILDGSEVMNASPGESEKFLRSKFQEAELLLEENESGKSVAEFIHQKVTLVLAFF